MKVLTYPLFFIGCAIFSCSPGNKSETISDQPAVVDSSFASTSQTPVAQTQPATPYVPPDSSFSSFTSLFEHRDTQLPSWAVAFLYQEDIGHITTIDLLETEPVVVVLFDRFMPIGPGMNELHVASFNPDGTLIKNAQLGSSYSSDPDSGGMDYSYQSYNIEQHVVVLTNSITEYSERTDSNVTNEMNSYYVIGKDGEITNGRKYPEISLQVLDPASLTSYSNEELKIMRNEIFASYGYIFKTEPMKSHYAGMSWYTPSTDNVDDMLNEIEKRNIKFIKQAEGQ